jgi:hypothetical protein
MSLLIVAFSLFMAGCGSQSGTTTEVSNPAPATVPVGLSVTDTPPAGVTVLFFQLSITGASLTTSSGTSVSLLSSANPVPINVSQLQTDSAFLGNANVAAGAYNGMNLTFSNPQLTIFNASDTTISSTCAVGKVCQVTPTTSGPLTLSFTSSPFPVTLSASSPLAFKLDIHLNTVIVTNSDGSIGLNLAATNGVTLSEFVTPVPNTSLIGPPNLGTLTGTVQGTGANQFTLQTLEDRTFTIGVDSGTTYSNFPSSSTCSTTAEAFGCLATGQVVNVMVSLLSGGSLLATAVDFVQLPTQQTVQGTIIGLSASGGNTIMDLVIQAQPAAANAAVLPVGRHASVTVPKTGVTYAINSGTFTIPSGLTFAGASNLQVGQQVLVVVNGSVTTASGTGNTNTGTPGPVGPPDVLFTASSITLEPSQITGTVAGVNASSLSFTLATLPVFLVPPSATANAAPNYLNPFIITVQTTSATTFTNFPTNSISGLAVNDVVSVHGWIFATPTGTTSVTVAADTVMDRPGPIPLF